MLAINLPPNSYRSLHFGFLGVHSADIPKESSKIKTHGSLEQRTRHSEKESMGDDEYVKETDSLLREVHQSIFNDQVFEVLNHEAFNQSVGVNVIGIRENYLQLSIGLQGPLSLFCDPSHLEFSNIFLDNLYESSSVRSTCRVPVPEIRLPEMKDAIKSQFQTKVVMNDDRINVEGEGALNVVGMFKSSEDICSVNKYDCDLADLPVIILLQVASYVVCWLHEEALTMGIKANRDFLCWTFELEQGETVSLVAHLDPEDVKGGISWCLVMEDGLQRIGNFKWTCMMVHPST